MIDTIEKIEETEWGLSVVLKDGITIDDNNVLPTIDYVIKELSDLKEVLLYV